MGGEDEEVDVVKMHTHTHIQKKELINASHVRFQSTVKNNFRETFRLIKFQTVLSFVSDDRERRRERRFSE